MSLRDDAIFTLEREYRGLLRKRSRIGTKLGRGTCPNCPCDRCTEARLHDRLPLEERMALLEEERHLDKRIKYLQPILYRNIQP